MTTDLNNLYFWCKDNFNRHTEFRSFFFSGAEETAFWDKKIKSAFTLGELSAIRWDLVYKKTDNYLIHVLINRVEVL